MVINISVYFCDMHAEYIEMNCYDICSFEVIYT
jgi:hypothetical protein